MAIFEIKKEVLDHLVAIVIMNANVEWEERAYGIFDKKTVYTIAVHFVLIHTKRVISRKGMLLCRSEESHWSPLARHFMRHSGHLIFSWNAGTHTRPLFSALLPNFEKSYIVIYLLLAYLHSPYALGAIKYEVYDAPGMAPAFVQNAILETATFVLTIKIASFWTGINIIWLK